MTERMPLFMSGWRYVSTQEEADALPQGALAIVDDVYLWDGNSTRQDWVPNLAADCWDGVVDVQQREMNHHCFDRGDSCTEAGCRYEWLETGDIRGALTPPLPFFAWHPTFCSST